jgi:xylulokinase
MDGRGAASGQALCGADPMAIPTWIERHGAIPLPSGADSLSHMLFLKNERPDAYESARYFLEPMDFLNFRLTGEATANLGTAFMMLLADNRDAGGPKWDSDLLTMAGIEKDKLPALVPMRGCVGALRPTVADELGLPAGVGVFSSMNDTQAAAIGTGAFLPGRGGLNVGTTCQVLAHKNEKATDFESHLVSIPSPVSGKYLVLAENGLGGGALRYFIEGVLFADGALGNVARAAPYATLDRALRDIPAGAGGALFLPWLAGAQFPDDDPSMRGGFLNISLDTTREHLVRAVVEGVSLNLCAMIEPVERFTGEPFAEIAFSGGGAQSAEWAQVLADVSGRPVHQLKDARFVNNLAGALMVFAEIGARELSSVTEMVRVERTLTPRADSHELYLELAEQQRKAFELLRPISHALRGG